MINLDYICMKYGSEIAASEGGKSDKEKLINNTLGVLQQNGPYAMFLYLEGHKKSEIAEACKGKLLKMFQKENMLGNSIKTDKPVPAENTNFSDITTWLQDISSDIDKLLFFKQICQQTLLYARYHIKALKDDNKN